MSEFYQEIVKTTKEMQALQLEDLMLESMIKAKNAIKGKASKGINNVCLEFAGLTLEAKQELADRLHKEGFISSVKKCTFESDSYFDSNSYDALGLHISW